MYKVHVFRKETEQWAPDQPGTNCESNDSLAVLHHFTIWIETCFVDQIICMSKFFDDINQMAKLSTCKSIPTLSIESGRGFRKARVPPVFFPTVMTMMFAKRRMPERRTESTAIDSGQDRLKFPSMSRIQAAGTIDDPIVQCST